MNTTDMTKYLISLGDTPLESALTDQFEAWATSATEDIQHGITDLEHLLHLLDIRTSVELYGVTPVIQEQNNQYLWDNFEFDLEPFTNGPNEQLSYCIEGLGSVIRSVIARIKRVLLRIIAWFTTESIFRTYLSQVQHYRYTLPTLYRQLTAVNEAKFGQCVISGYNYEQYRNLITANQSMIPLLLSTLKLPSSLQEAEYTKLITTVDLKLRACGYYLTQSGTLETIGAVLYRQGGVKELNWSGAKVVNCYNPIYAILTQAIELEKYKFQVAKQAQDIIQMLDKLERTGTVRSDDLDNIKRAKSLCIIAQHVSRTIVTQTVTLSRQWCQMAKLCIACS